MEEWDKVPPSAPNTRAVARQAETAAVAVRASSLQCDDQAANKAQVAGGAAGGAQMRRRAAGEGEGGERGGIKRACSYRGVRTHIGARMHHCSSLCIGGGAVTTDAPGPGKTHQMTSPI
jgi:hypothetical protein